MDEIIKAHDELLANMPEGASHDKDQCPVCNPDLLKDQEPNERGEVDTFTQEQVDAAVKAALAPVQDELAALKAASAAGELEAKISEAVAEKDAEISELKDKLDAADVKSANAEQLLADSLAWIQAVVDEAEAAERAESIKEARAAKVAEATSFSAEKIAERIDDWAKLSDEEFEARLAEWSELSTARKEGAPVAESAAATVVHGTRSEKSGDKPFLANVLSLTEKASEAGLNLDSF